MQTQKKSAPTTSLKCKLFHFFLKSCYNYSLGMESTVAFLYNFNIIKYSFSSFFVPLSLSLSLSYRQLSPPPSLLLLLLQSYIQTAPPPPSLSSSSSSILSLPALLSIFLSSSCLVTVQLKSPPFDQTHHKTQPPMGLTMSNIGRLCRSNDG